MRARARAIQLPHHGEVWWLEDPEIGRRPVLILTRESAIAVLTGILIAPVTRTIRGIPSEVVLDLDDGMPERSAISMDNLRTVPRAMLTRRLTALPDARRQEICDALCFAVAC